MSDQQRPRLTDRQGHPIHDNQHLRSVGVRGPATLENYHFLEKISHFDRERVPERVVHARGAAAHGYFEAYGTIGGEPSGTYSRAKLFDGAGKRTPIFVRFSTVVGGKESPETMRDPRGFAIKFYTEDGNWDLVGNNLKIFFIRDAMKFPDMVHAFKPDPVTGRYEARRVFDFVQFHPEAIHMVTWVQSPWGIPATYREMEGSGVNTYKLVAADGTGRLCKFHFEPKQGVRNLTAAEAKKIQAEDTSHATNDLYDAIERGDHPEWEMFVQVMDDGEHPELDFDPLDATKLWPRERFPFLPVGRIVLNRNPQDRFTETEQVAFGTGNLVDGIDFSDDKLLQGRTFSYSDTQRYRVGSNYLQLPINAPQCPFATNQRDGQMAFRTDTIEAGADPRINYEPSSRGGAQEDPSHHREYRYHVEGEVGYHTPVRVSDDYRQAGERYRTFTGAERDELVANLGGALRQCPDDIALRMVWHFWHADEDYGRRVADAAGVDLERAKALPPLPGKPAPVSGHPASA